MAGFFPHTGGYPSGYTALPVSTFSTILDDIVADVGTGQNGWTLHDDQRSGFTPLVWAANVAGANYASGNLTNISFTASSQAISQTTSGRFRRNWIIGGGTTGTFISTDQTNWYYLSALASQVAGTLDRNYTGGTAQNHLVYEKSGPYIVLKCTSSQKTFYVLIARPVSYGISLRLQVFESWNAGTHVGTNGGPMEELRAYEDGTGRAGTHRLQYLLFLLPDVLGLWVSGYAADGGTYLADFFYTGNLNPLRVGDNTCLVQACSHQELSGIYPSTNATYSTANNRTGTAPMFKNIGGEMWTNPAAAFSFNDNCGYMLFPRGASYVFGIDRTNLDDGAKFQFCEMDAYYCGAANNGFTANEGKRGELRHLKVPVMNPSGLHLASLGPADDGNTYLLFKVSGPQQLVTAITSLMGDTVYNSNAASGFYFNWRNGTLGDLNVATSNYQTMGTRWFMMPINL